MAIGSAFLAGLGARSAGSNESMNRGMDMLLQVLQQRKQQMFQSQQQAQVLQNQNQMFGAEQQAIGQRQQAQQQFQTGEREAGQKFTSGENVAQRKYETNKQMVQNLFQDYERRQAQSFTKELEKEKSPVERAKKVEEYLNQADMQGNPVTDEIKKQRMQILGIKETGMVSVKNLVDSGAISKEAGQSLLSRGVNEVSEKEAAIHQKATTGKILADARSAALQALKEYHKTIAGGGEVKDLATIVGAADKLRDNIATAEKNKSGFEAIGEFFGASEDKELKDSKELLAEMDEIIKQRTGAIRGGGKPNQKAPSGQELEDMARQLPR